MRKRSGGSLAAIVLSASAFSPAFGDNVATEAPKDIYFFSQAYYVVQDNERAIFDDEGLGFRLGFGWQIDGGWHWESNLAHNTLETGIGGFTDYYQTHLGVDAVYRFGRENGVRPFVLLGIGAVHDDVFPVGGRSDENETSFFSNVGFGITSPELFGVGLKLRADARYVRSEFEDGFEDGHFNLGFEIPLRRDKKVVTRTVVKEVVREVPVAATDSDNDGVVDGVDRCPNTLRGAKVDQHGCALKAQVVKLEGINFRTGSADLTGDSVESLSEVTAFLANQENVRIEIAGHTDATGAAAFNQRLSQQRAESVRLFLIRAGIDPTRMRAVGYGESQPVASNATELGRAANRRVEFRIMN